jgi:hypothetical protein
MLGLLVAGIALAVATVGLASMLGPDGSVASPTPPGPAGSAPRPSPGGTERPTSRSPSPLTTDERIFADAYLARAEGHDRQVVELLIANPLSEYDLVGVPLTDLLDETRRLMAALPAPASVADRLAILDREVTATVALLGAIDPHGPRGDIASEYTAALDYWADHVRPVSEAVRALLGLPAVPLGDLQL